MAVVAALAASVTSVPAQLARRVMPEVRADAFLARRSALHAGLGANLPLARSVRLEIVGGVGSTLGPADEGLSGRIDAIGRFLLDPEDLLRWSGYVGGGTSLRYAQPADWRGFVTRVIGVEAPRPGRVAPFFEIGYGGGVRVGVGVRRGVRGRR